MRHTEVREAVRMTVRAPRRRSDVAASFVVRAAAAAPSVCNSQPWYFSSRQNAIRLHADPRRRLILWGSNTRSWRWPAPSRGRAGPSGGDLVLVDEPAEDLFSADPALREVDLQWPGVSLSR